MSGEADTGGNVVVSLHVVGGWGGTVGTFPCTGNTHYFAVRPGYCECGAEFWEADPPPEPKLRLVE